MPAADGGDLAVLALEVELPAIEQLDGAATTVVGVHDGVHEDRDLVKGHQIHQRVEMIDVGVYTGRREQPDQVHGAAVVETDAHQLVHGLRPSEGVCRHAFVDG